MYTDNTSLLGVTSNLPRTPSHRRVCDLLVDPIYGPFIRYSGKEEEVDLGSSFIPELLHLVPAFSPLDLPQVGGLFGPSTDDKPEHILLEVELEPDQVLIFLNKWGMVGRTSDLFTSPLYSEYYPPNGLEFDDPEISWEKKINCKETIPYYFVIDELVRMARCTRLVLRLLHSGHSLGEEFSLTLQVRKRIVSGWGLLPLAIPPGKDPATYKTLDDTWVLIGTYRGKQYKYVEMADIALDEFAQKMNSYLKPITEPIIRTQAIEEIYSGRIGLETALAAYLVQQLSLGGAPLKCANCKMDYFPERRKKNAKYCSNRCGAAVRTRKYRQNNKKSSIHIGDRKEKGKNEK